MPSAQQPTPSPSTPSDPESDTGVSANSAANPTRRRLLVGGAAAVAASAAATIAAQPASAANGGAVLLGKANSATVATGVTATTSASTLAVTNGGAGPAATLTSYTGHGAVQTTRAGNRWGSYAINSATTNAGGGAFLANGGKTTGAYVTSAGVQVDALHASQTVPLASVTGNEAAVNAVGNAADAVQAMTTNVDSYGVVATHYDSGSAVLGSSDAGIGVIGMATAGGSGLYGLAGDGTSYSLTADGTALFLGDVVVQGTLYAPTVVNGLPPGFAGDGVTATTASARRLAARAAKKAAQLRAQLG